MPKCVHVSEITVFQYCVLVTESLESPCLESLSSLKVNIFHWLPSVWASGTLTEMREYLKVRVWCALRGPQEALPAGANPWLKLLSPSRVHRVSPLAPDNNGTQGVSPWNWRAWWGQRGNRCFKKERALAEGNECWLHLLCRVPFLGSFPKIWPTLVWSQEIPST